MEIFITGGTGFVGTTLAHRLVEQGHQITVLTRKISGNMRPEIGISLIEGDPTKKGEFGNVLLKGQRALPKSLSDAGFDFQFPGIDDALQGLLG